MPTARKAVEVVRPAQDSQAQREYAMLLEALAVATERARGWTTPVEPAQAPDVAEELAQ